MNDTISVGQLIYTNVEADRSPTRQRGFQVWLATSDLSPDHRRGIAKRVDEFRLPVGASADDASLARHVYFRLPDGRFVIARTVPMTDRDKFGRGGKFFAHAVVLHEADFERLGFNPFRVIDGGFPFLRHPNDVAGDGWKSGEPPPASVESKEPNGEERTLPPAFEADFFALCEREVERPVVVAEKPAFLLTLLRRLFRQSLPEIRRRLEFDTLSTGGSLQQIKYPLVGGFSAEHMRLWSYRRFHKFDPATGLCTPPLEPATATLKGQLSAAPGWSELSDADRVALTDEAKALAARALEDLKPDRLGPPARRVLEQCPGYEEAIRAAAQARLECDLPLALLGLPRVKPEAAKYLDPAGPAVLDRVARPLPRPWVSNILFDAFEQSGSGSPAAEVLAALENWLNRDSESHGRLDIYLMRWRRADEDILRLNEWLRAGLESDPDFAWFLRWLPTTLDPALCGGPEKFASRVKIGRSLEASVVRDAQLALTFQDKVRTAEWEEARLVLAYYGGEEALKQELGKPPSRTALGWLAAVVETRLQGRCQFCIMSEGVNEDYIGLVFAAEDGTDEALLDAACESFNTAAIKDVLWSLVTPPSGRSLADETEPDIPKTIKKLYANILKAEPREIARAVREFQDHLREAADGDFRLAANLLLQRLSGTPVLKDLGEGTYFLGLKFFWMQFDKPQNLLGLLGAVAGSIVPDLPLGTPPDSRKVLTTGQHRRFSWFLARLQDPAQTGHLRV